MDVTNEKEKIEYERNEKADEAEKLGHEKTTLLQEIEELHKSHQSLIQSTAASDASSTRNSTGGESTTLTPHSSVSNLEARDAELERQRQDVDRPLKRKVSQLDKNLEQLTVMYHKLVAQNSGLKVEVSENDKKIQRKDQRIGQLERNLREAKQKYEKLLTQCANLTAAMDVMGRTKPMGFSGGGGGGGGGGSNHLVRRSPNIVRPVRGGIATYRDGADVGLVAFNPADRQVSEPASTLTRESSQPRVR